MIRYWGEPYEGSDDQVNDMIRAEQENEKQAANSEKVKKAKKEHKDFWEEVAKIAPDYQGRLFIGGWYDVGTFYNLA